MLSTWVPTRQAPSGKLHYRSKTCKCLTATWLQLCPVSKTVCAQIRIPSLKWCTLLNTDQAMPQVCVHIHILKTHKNKSSPLTPKYIHLSFFDRKQSHILLTSDASLSLLWPTCIWKLFWGTSGPCTKFMKLNKKEISWNSVETQRGLLYFFLLYLSSCNILLVDTDIKSMYLKYLWGYWSERLSLERFYWQSCMLGGSALWSFWQLNIGTIQSFQWDPHVQIKPALG